MLAHLPRRLLARHDHTSTPPIPTALAGTLSGESLEQLGAVSGVMRTQSTGFALPPKVRPQVFGPDLLMAPVLEAGATSRAVYLPADPWIDLWRSATWDAHARRLVLGPVALSQGPAVVTVLAPLDELPLFVRAGAVLPLPAADVDTLADYGGQSPGLVRLADRADRLALLTFRRGRTTARFFERNEPLRSVETDRGWALDVRGRRTRRWDVTAALGTLERPVVPC